MPVRALSAFAVTLGLGLALTMSPPQVLAEEASSTEEELSELIQRSRKNPLSAAARQRSEAAAALVDDTNGRRWATIDLTSFVAPSPRIICDNPECTVTSPRNATVNIAGIFAGLNFRVTQPLYTGGKLTSGREAAEEAEKASIALEDKVAGDVSVQVAKAYYGLLLAQELIWMLEDGKERIDSGLASFEEKLESGEGETKISDRFRIQGLQAEVLARLADATHAKTVALAALRALVGDPELSPKGGLLEALDFELPGAVANDKDPTLRAAKHAANAMAALADVERAGYIPDIGIVGGYNIARAQGVDDPPGAFANDPFNFQGAYVALSARWNFAPFRQGAKVRVQEAKQREAEEKARAAERWARLAGSEAIAKAQLHRQRLEAMVLGERAGKAWVASVVQAEAIGEVSAKDLADAYIAFFSARAQVLESTYQWNVAVYELRRLAGDFAR